MGSTARFPSWLIGTFILPYVATAQIEQGFSDFCVVYKHDPTWFSNNISDREQIDLLPEQQWSARFIRHGDHGRFEPIAGKLDLSDSASVTLELNGAIFSGALSPSTMSDSLLYLLEPFRIIQRSASSSDSALTIIEFWVYKITTKLLVIDVLDHSEVKSRDLPRKFRLVLVSKLL